MAFGTHLMNTKPINNTVIPSKAGGVLIWKWANKKSATKNSEYRNRRPTKNWPIFDATLALECTFLVGSNEIIRPFF